MTNYLDSKSREYGQRANVTDNMNDERAEEMHNKLGRKSSIYPKLYPGY